MKNYRKNFDFVYSVDGYITTEEPFNLEDVQMAAVMEIYDGYKLVSRDQFVPAGCWVDAVNPDATEKAIALRLNSF